MAVNDTVVSQTKRTADIVFRWSATVAIFYEIVMVQLSLPNSPTKLLILSSPSIM